jgi:uracil-DNA glycosylase family 4
MAEHHSLLWPDAGPIERGKKSKNPRLHLRGCKYCPLNEVKGIQKIKGTVEGKDIFVWAQSPGPQENLEGIELWGKSGQWFWARMKQVGLRREQCDIQNVQRCFPADRKDGQLHMRDPSKEELFCCSLYTDRAIAKSKAKVHIVLGKVAAKQLFGNKYHGDKIFWSDKLNGRVVVLDHPAYFLRGVAPQAKYHAFDAGLKAAARFAKEKGGKFSYLEEQDYKGITTVHDSIETKHEIQEAAKKVRVAVDLEDGEVDGKRVALSWAFSIRPGWARVYLADHEERKKLDPITRAALRSDVKELLTDKNIRKSLQHGSYDLNKNPSLLGYEIEGYDYDTNYAEYFRYPGRRSYALAEIAAVRFPEFTGFKEVVMPEAAPEGMTYDAATKAGKLDFSKVPWKRLVLRNAADADLTKRIEVSTKKEISLPLLHVYMDAAFTLDRMEKNGPWFDAKQCDLLGEIYPARLKRQKEELQIMAGDPNFNPGSPLQVSKVLYGKLKLPVLGKKVTTGHATLEALDHYHEMPKKIIAYRSDSKLESTYRMAFKNCAAAHGGRLFTKFWLTGTKTGRLSSGGSREGEEFLTVNLQNIVGDQHVENMLVSDLHWRELYDAWKEHTSDEWYKPFLDYYVYLKFDYAQNELRFLAQTSGDESLIETFRSGKDIHCEVGHELTGWPRELIAKDRDKRTTIKGFHFGLIYGLTAEGIVTRLLREGVSKTIANVKAVSEMLARYFKRYARVKAFIDRMRRMAEEKSYVENILGFRCPIDVNADTGGYWENLAVNAPIQGGAHQVLLICLALLHREPEKYKLIRTPESENHDAVSIRVRLRRLFEGRAVIKQLAEHDVIDTLKKDFKLDWRVPFKADIKAGFRYGVMVDIEEGMQLGQFLENWCVENQKCQRELWKEIRSVRGAQ